MAQRELPPATIASGMEFKLHIVIGQGDVAAVGVHRSPRRRRRRPAAAFVGVVIPGCTAAIMISSPWPNRGVGGISDVAPPGGSVGRPPHRDVCHHRPHSQEAPERVMTGVRP